MRDSTRFLKLSEVHLGFSANPKPGIKRAVRVIAGHHKVGKSRIKVGVVSGAERNDPAFSVDVQGFGFVITAAQVRSRRSIDPETMIHGAIGIVANEDPVIVTIAAAEGRSQYDDLSIRLKRDVAKKVGMEGGVSGHKSLTAEAAI